MGIIRSWVGRAGRRAASVVAGLVGEDELFEKVGERPKQAPLPPAPSAPLSPAPLSPAPLSPAPVSPAPVPRSATPPRAPAPHPAAPRSSSSVSSPRVPSTRPAQATWATLDQLRAAVGPGGRWRVVNHWATWCIPCVEEFPALRALHAALGQEVDMFGISWDMFDPRGDEDDIQEHVENFAVGHSVGWPSLIIEGRIKPESFFAAFELSYDKIPQTWVVSPEGLVVRRVNGALDAAGGQELRAFIEQQLKGA